MSSLNRIVRIFSFTELGSYFSYSSLFILHLSFRIGNILKMYISVINVPTVRVPMLFILRINIMYNILLFAISYLDSAFM